MGNDKAHALWKFGIQVDRNYTCMVKVDRLERKGRHSHYTEIFITSVDLSLFAHFCRRKD